MSDEAFARRFYSDRAELTALGVPLQSQRDEFTGEELYTLRSEHYFLERLDLDDDELAALQTALYYLEGKFAYAEPLRLALQNLALGRAGFPEPPTETAARVRVSAPDYSPELAGRLAKLESAISKQRTVRFGYWSPRRARPGERTVNPYALRLDDGNWYVVGHDSSATRCGRSRSRGSAATSASQRGASATSGLLRISTSTSTASRVRGRSARSSGEHASPSRMTPPGGSRDPLGRGRRGGRRVRDRLLERRSPRRLGAPPERPCRAARARRAGRLGAGCPRRTGGRARRRSSGRCRPEAGRPATAAPRAPDRPGRPRAVRGLAGPARPAPDGLR